MSSGPVLTYSDIKDLKAQGHNQTEIATMYGVTRAYVSKIVRSNEPKVPTPRERAISEGYPWKVQPEHFATNLYRVTRNHLDYVVNGPEGLTEHNLDRLRGFYRSLEDFDSVVGYSPDVPPSPSNPLGGFFFFAPREESDGDLIIRVNDHTNIDNKNLKLWRMPDELP